MSFRMLLHPDHSKAEYQLTKAFSDAGLLQGCYTDWKIDLGDGRQTTPDWCWPATMKAVYLDGDAVHRWRRMDRDAEIDELLRALGWRVLRVRYHAPLHPKSQRLIEIVEETRRFLKGGER